MQVLGIDVVPSLSRRWREWLAPSVQPFFLSDAQVGQCGFEGSVLETRAMSDELRDTYARWRIDRDLKTVWLDEQAFHALPRTLRALLVRAQVEHRRGLVPTVRRWADSFANDDLRDQADGHRFVWWPTMLEQADDALLGLIVTRVEGLLPSRHREVPRHVWTSAARILPGAEELAGTFPSGSGPNCFGSVMAAAGVPDAASTWMMQEPFEAWLRENTLRTTGNRRADIRPGRVLVWRAPDGSAQHTAVTLGEGWALHKPSQSWATPRKVLTVGEVLRVSRAAGLRLHRYVLHA